MTKLCNMKLHESEKNVQQSNVKYFYIYLGQVRHMSSLDMCSKMKLNSNTNVFFSFGSEYTL